jgi:hypothetical protein
MIRRILVAVVLVALVVGVAAFPMIWEGTSGPCAALETRFARLTSAGRSPRDMPPEFREIAPLIGMLMMATRLDGTLAERYMLQANPDRPAWISCTLSYWRMLDATPAR